jgi:preflagellin peptidase FlaK
MKGREPDDRVLQKLKKARRNGKIEKVWVTPGLPFLIFVTIGFLTSAIFGDMLFEVLLRFLH